jgi:uncharacterized protein RhaS with RHS repeats
VARQNKRDKAEALAKKTARQVKKVEQLTDRIAVLEREIVSAQASGGDPSELRYRLNDVRRRVRGPAKQKSSMMARLEGMGGLDLLKG